VSTVTLFGVPFEQVLLPNAWGSWIYWLIEGDEVIYIGMTGDVHERMRKHARTTSWWQQVTRGVALRYPHSYQVGRIEQELIHERSPRYNYQFTPAWRQARARGERV
jgi:predicted GIY-YIG superfamily endonuclease